MRLKICQAMLQLDELVAAVGSPIGAAAKDQQQAVGPHQFAHRPSSAVLIGEGEIHNFLADFWTRAIAVVLSVGKGLPILRLELAAADLLHRTKQNRGFGLHVHVFYRVGWCSRDAG